MIFSVEGGGTVAFFSQAELKRHADDPRRLTEAELLSLLRTACVKLRHPLPPHFELDAFATADGVLLFVSPCCPPAKTSEAAFFPI